MGKCKQMGRLDVNYFVGTLEGNLMDGGRQQDKFLPIGAGERYAAGIAGAKLVSFEKCVHVPPIEKTEEFLAAAAAFLGSGATAAQ
jgi:hypothetical protein